jgi:transposase
MNITTIGLDIAKNVFQVHAVDKHGKTVLQRKLSRAKVLLFFAKLPSALVGIEACPGAHYWARELIKLGHEVRLIPAQHAKRYLTGDKTDARDAQAICEAVGRPSMTFVAVNTEGQQDIQMVHRIRQRLMRERTALMLQIRGLLNEYGIVFAQGAHRVMPYLRLLLAQDNGFSGLAHSLWQDQLEQLIDLETRIARYDDHIKQLCEQDEQAQRLKEIPGIGPLTATALVAAVGNARHYRSGRKLAASLGLVPKEHSSGGKQRLLGISKRGNTYLRTLLIHGARTVLRYAERKTDPLSQWALGLKVRKGYNIAAVALANKLARIAWAVLAHNDRYDANRRARV